MSEEVIIKKFQKLVKTQNPRSKISKNHIWVNIHTGTNHTQTHTHSESDTHTHVHTHLDTLYSNY